MERKYASQLKHPHTSNTSSYLRFGRYTICQISYGMAYVVRGTKRMETNARGEKNTQAIERNVATKPREVLSNIFPVKTKRPRKMDRNRRNPPAAVLPTVVSANPSREMKDN